MKEATSKKSARAERRREEQVRIGLIEREEPEYPPAGTYSSYHHGVPRHVKKILRKKLIKATRQYLRVDGTEHPDRKRTARGIVRGMAQAYLYIENAAMEEPFPGRLEELEAEIIDVATELNERAARKS